MENIFDQIEMVDENMIPEVMVAVLERYNALFPDWHISTIAIEKERDRKAQIEASIRVLQTLLEIEETDMPLPTADGRKLVHGHLRLVEK